MKNFNTTNLINDLTLDRNLKEDLHNKILAGNFKFDKDILDFILVYISKLEHRVSKIVFNELSLKTGLAYDELMSRCEWLHEMDLEGVQLSKNHKELYEIFDSLNILFQENNIEHYYTSGILSFLLVGQELERYHHDIDVFVNETDLEKLEAVSQIYGFSFYRKLGDRKNGTKRIMLKMQFKEIDIPITVFMYEREKDNSITQKDYYYDLNGNLMVELIYNNELSAKLSFNDEIKYFHNIPYKAISLEALYLCKKGGRPKDEYDCAVFKDYVNEKNLNDLIVAVKSNKPSENVLLKDKTKIDFLTKSNDKGLYYGN
ncbi:MAG: hypothetical protein IKM43_00310 [Clostridia bacterium]|nr:hypothetical protein [Clostridia bacterium]